MAEEKEIKKKKEKEEMTLAEAKAYRAALYKQVVQELTEQERKEQFRLFWAQERHNYGKAKDLEEILWLHLKSSKMDSPEKFQDGLNHFGLKKNK